MPKKKKRHLNELDNLVKKARKMEDDGFTLKHPVFSYNERNEDVKDDDGVGKIVEENGLWDGMGVCLKCIAYGLGSFETSKIARTQLALLMVLKEKLKIETIETFDPVYTAVDEGVLVWFGVMVGKKNEMGFRHVDERTFFYMPHCGKRLYENVVAANWGTLERIFIVGNSFEAYQMMPQKADRSPLLFFVLVYDMFPFTTEIPFPTTFPDRTVFNNTSLHVFRVDEVGKEVWEMKVGRVEGDDEVV
ncbi:hypothetical protein BC829DRAFT_382136 [Chytridium lagenaria]|nr:hypothetical protein BC829DRAFT_382136 [Chytridium lagenaria]